MTLIFNFIQNFDTRVRAKVPEIAGLSCSDLLTAYRLTQNLNRNRPYKYDPAETMDLHRFQKIVSCPEINLFSNCFKNKCSRNQHQSSTTLGPMTHSQAALSELTRSDM